MGNNHPNTIKERTWLEKCSEDHGIYVFLVESPLTFGHSQLILKTENVTAEEEMFDIAAPALKESISILKKKLPEAMDKLLWKKLRDYTQTSGGLIKILILKVSADEKKKQYKVHIMPYFESHLCLTTILFQKGKVINEGKTGGMIRWLGEQEKRVDEQIEIWRGTCRFPTALVESFELIKLAEHLKGK